MTLAPIAKKEGVTESPEESVDPIDSPEFQALFVRTMLAEVQRSMPGGSLLGDELEMFGDILMDELAANLSVTGAFSIGGGGDIPLSSMGYLPEQASLRSAYLPVSGRMSSEFGHRSDPLHGGQRHHDGLDIAASTGTSIRAALGGVVVSSGLKGGYGQTVVVEHDDGSRALYAHCSRLDVGVGERIRPGQPIAAVGSTGRSTGPHLHFELRVNGHAVDPRDHLAFRIP